MWPCTSLLPWVRGRMCLSATYSASPFSFLLPGAHFAILLFTSGLLFPWSSLLLGSFSHDPLCSSGFFFLPWSSLLLCFSFSLFHGKDTNHQVSSPSCHEYWPYILHVGQHIWQTWHFHDIFIIGLDRQLRNGQEEQQQIIPMSLYLYLIVL